MIIIIVVSVPVVKKEKNSNSNLYSHILLFPIECNLLLLTVYVHYYSYILFSFFFFWHLCMLFKLTLLIQKVLTSCHTEVLAYTLTAVMLHSVLDIRKNKNRCICCFFYVAQMFIFFAKKYNIIWQFCEVKSPLYT